MFFRPPPPHQNLVYDLGDATKWEFFFPNVDKPLLVVPGDEPKLDEPEDEEDLEVLRMSLLIVTTYTENNSKICQFFCSFQKCPKRLLKESFCGIENSGTNFSSISDSYAELWAIEKLIFLSMVVNISSLMSNFHFISCRMKILRYILSFLLHGSHPFKYQQKVTELPGFSNIILYRTSYMYHRA